MHGTGCAVETWPAAVGSDGVEQIMRRLDRGAALLVRPGDRAARTAARVLLEAGGDDAVAKWRSYGRPIPHGGGLLLRCEGHTAVPWVLETAMTHRRLYGNERRILARELAALGERDAG
ncbi:hypothetical protein [Streptomyces canus]|uniref:hypothetical protein n=1 Tax=Streptomyces canus TaxID=58343 RepID=UPI00278700BF|nr:hypothetical protein [Streptomyces canus]MDQ1067079.1 hypothetical protein [Streptomyces canus]